VADLSAGRTSLAGEAPLGGDASSVLSPPRLTTLLGRHVLVGGAVALRGLAMLGLNKVLAATLGPAGFVTVGQFQNIVQICLATSSGSINAGVIRQTSKARSPQEAGRLWRTAFAIIIACTTLTAIMLLAAARPIATMWLADPRRWWVVAALAASLFLATPAILLTSVVNGRQQIGLYTACTVGAVLAGLAGVSLLTRAGGLDGALLGLALSPALALPVALFVCRGQPWLRLSAFVGAIDRPTARRLLGFSLMAGVSAFALPTAQTLIRHHLTGAFGAEATGYWEASVRVSLLFQAFVLSSFGVQYLPRLAARNDARGVIEEMRPVAALVALASLAVTVGLYLGRHVAVGLMFSKAFAPAADLFFWQLVGDDLRAVAWIFSFVLIARAETRRFIVLELCFYGAWVAATIAFTSQFGFRAASQGYAAASAVSAVMSFLMWRAAMRALPDGGGEAS
jgi:PST family polysaccharide transporter